MSILIGTYPFEGPFNSTEHLENKSGVYVILCSIAGNNYVIDIGESSEVKNRIENHDRSDCWDKQCNGLLFVCVYYTPNQQQAGRKIIEQELRRIYNPPCGEQ